VSLIHQKVLVIAEVAWEPRVTRGVYLVTWEVDGGGLKGNLFTDSTCVTLSLWPDTIYHIQVGCSIKYIRITSIKSQSFCMATFSASLTNLSALLPQSRDISCYVSRPILAPPPLWLRKHTDLRAYDFAHPPAFWHQPRLAKGYLRLKLETLWN